MLFSSAASAAGLGKLTVLSSLGQPLRAEIELTAVSSEEAGALTAKLAPSDAFRLANIEFNPALLSLRFAVESRNGRQVIKISSTQPVNEPFVDMLLELSWNSGRLVREYTFLLDPAELRSTQSAQVTAPVDVLKQGTPAGTPAPVSQSVKPAPAASAAAAPKAERPAPKAGAAEYKVKPGDTLGRIAAETKPADISLDMMLVALYRANPDAFVGNNMNRLKSGQILSVPDAESIKGGGGEGEARGVVVAHAADFNAYRSKLAGQVAASAPAKAAEATQSAGGKITAKVEERPTATTEAKDQLKLSKTLPSAAASAAGKTTSTEDKIAKEKQLADAAARVKELEKNVGDLEKLMAVKNKAGAKKASVPDLTEELTKTPPPPPKPKPVVKKAAPPPPPGIVDMLMDNITIIGGALAALLLGAFAVVARKKKKDAKPAVEPSILGAPSEAAHSLFAETGGQSVDTNNSVFNSSFAPSASQLDTNEVDPVAEADVYIAYGRDAQAEEILKEALRTHPERMPVRLKLLEIYAARKDQRAFEAQATEMYSLTKGQGDDWSQAAALGLTIDPLNPLYAGAGGTSATPAPSAEERDQQAMLSAQLDEALAAEAPAAMDLDLDLSAEPAETALPVVEAAPAPKMEEDHSLDFDLGGLSFEPISATEPIAMPGPAAAPTAAPAPTPAEESFDMAFDMAFDTPAAPATAPAEETALDDISLDLAPVAAPVAEPDFGMADLSKEFDLPPLPSASEPVAASSTPDPLLDLDAMNFDLPSAAPAAPAAPDVSADDPFALADLGMPTSAPEPATAAAHDFDLSGIDLDLPSMSPGATDSNGALPDFGGDQLATAAPEENSAAHMEMETKLDLAIAYQEIGDKEGARELIDEVIRGGSAEQVSKANAMRAQLS
ncbi:MAG: FimV/HubP family polar landmark protein [Pseudomonadota bacterium]